MSHSTVLVVGKDPEGQLEPFNEQLEVESYQEDCYCIGNIARGVARARVDIEYMTIDKLRGLYHAMPREKRPDWKEHIKKYNELEEKYVKEHELYNKPDPKCDECKGSGKRETTSNPDSKWDWYVLGGRWTGYWKLKASAKPRYKGTEFIGRPGVGDNKPLFDVDMAKKEDIDFKGMKAIRKRRAEERWATWQAALKGTDERAKREAELHIVGWTGKRPTKEQYIKECTDVSTFAVLMDGTWYEKGTMGWWGFVSNEKSDEQWQAEFDKLLAGLPGKTWLSVYDVHI